MGWSGFRNKKEGPQQGTLFDVRSVPSQPVNSPGMQKRGRREEMLAAMPETTVYETGPGFWDVEDKIRDRSENGIDSSIPARARAQAGKQERALMSHRLADETTVDPDALRGLRRIEVGQTDSILPQNRVPKFSPGVAGRYQENSERIQAPRRMTTTTLTHEIGHHNSRYHEGNTRTGEAPVQLRSGHQVDLAEEGRADAFAHAHIQGGPERTYATMARGSDDEEKLTGAGSRYRQEREAAGQPLRPKETSRPPDHLSSSQFPRQLTLD